MIFEIKYDRQPERFLKQLDNHLIRRIMDKIDELLISNSVPHTAKPIVGEHGVFRIRIGDYRALYRVNYQTSIIVITQIEKRDKVYK